jgi:acetylornithine deacetylase/succinyl-diaminopimelate desuccinylase-like protein
LSRSDLIIEVYQGMEYKFEKYLDFTYLVNTLTKLLKIDCTVPLGPQTLMEPNDPKLVHYVQEIIRPELVANGSYNIMDMPKNQIVVRLGTGENDTSLLIMVYTPVQHNNWMRDPHSGKISVPVTYGWNEPCAWGQGADHNSHMAVMLTLLKAFVDGNVKLKGTLYFAVNNEGRSSHECSWAMIPQLNPKPKFGLLLHGGENQISIANRGRVDVLIHIKGQITHSSWPEGGLSAIDGAVEVLNRIKQMKFTKRHPKLGGQHAVPYQLIFDPLAPHTLPGYARIKIDRRLLPGDDVDEAVTEIVQAIGDMKPWEVTVEKDVVMLPSVVDPEAGIVKALQKATSSIDAKEATLKYQKSAYDAGGPTSLGIPSVMWGRIRGESIDIMGDRFVALRSLEDEVKTVGRLIIDMLG